GSTAWELALHGVPAALVPVADNQVPVAAAVAAAGAAVAVDGLDPGVLAATVRDLAADRTRRRAMAAAGRSLVDGRGATRVAAAARSLLVRLRPAISDDAGLLWAWANDPATRAAAFDPSPIPWDDHVAWLGDRIADPDAGVWVAEDLDGAPLGQVRVELEGDGDGRVSIVVAPERRGRGWAAPILSAAARDACDSLGARGLRRLRAEVLPGNDRSGAAFTSADFDRVADGLRGGRAHHTYTRRCDG
ncbi:MAG: GNAT family N-acetyltransferase, partial [Acidimicrobiales bacterium]|nr:GNAT family N-acetyltransferase [Acidimicrobiales bacterium]